MARIANRNKYPVGFSLAEVLAALTVGAMVLVAMLSIYSRAESSAAAITRMLDSSRLASEVLQRIAEDLDRIIASGAEVRITVENKFEKGYPTARLTILKTINDGKGRRDSGREFEKIIWQTSPDYESDVNGLVLLRSHGGMALEDKLLDEKRAEWEKDYPFVPICQGVTLFTVQVPKGEDFLNKWPGTTLPHGIAVTISFAEPFETLQGTLDVEEEEKITRTIAIDRTRKIKFELAAKGEEGDDEEDMEDDEEDKEDEDERAETGEERDDEKAAVSAEEASKTDREERRNAEGKTKAR